MKGRYPSEPPNNSQQHDRHATPNNKRKFRETYDPSVNEQFPENPWYALNHEIIIDQVGELCDELTIPLENYGTIDEGIANLIVQAGEAKKLPNMKKLRVAVVGEQGIGKSTLVNALLDRKLLDKSGGSSACTAFATVIEYKKGAADNIKSSDVKIEFLAEEEVEAFTKDQVNRWADCYRGPQSNRRRKDDEGDSNDSSAEQRSDDRHTPTAEAGVDKKKLQKAAKTAKEFFGIVFNTQENVQQKQWLENVLHKTNIREGDFRTHCLAQAKHRLNDIATQLRAQNGVSVRPDVSDGKLVQTRNLVKKIWPFVKVVTISTGHVLLRHGICFLDLPGYGDTSQLRDAVVNMYRGLADYETVVTPHARLQTSTRHDRYLDRSLDKGANRTMLVMTKSDALFDVNDYPEDICQIQEESFISLSARLEHLNELAEQGDEGADYDMLKENIMREAAVATVERETKLIQESMRDKGIEIFSTAPKEYMAWKNPNRVHDPFLHPEACGIPGLRRHLFSLPAETNFKRYRKHVFKELPRLRKRAVRVQENHVEDEGYAEMRRELQRQTPALRLLLDGTAETQMQRLVAVPWEKGEEQKVIDSIENLISQKWKHPLIFYNGFAKMLRENGIPINGAYCGRNLNEELLETMIQYIDNWNTKMTTRAQELAQRLNGPVQDLFTAIKLRIDGSSAVPALKERATEALTEALQGVEEAHAALLESLLSTLSKNHMRYTSEVDILCPIAKEMQPRYDRAQDVCFVGSGKGAYQRQRNVLRESILNPARHYSRLPPMEHICPLVKNLKEQLMSRQHELWKANCTTFIEAVDVQLQEFSRIAAELLMNAAYMTEEHRKARELLNRLLKEFDQNLKNIQDQFVDAEKEHSRKKTKVKQEDDEAVPDAAGDESTQPAPATGQEVGVPILRNFGWHHFRATIGRLG